MASARPRSFWLDALIRGVRFLYLLWGGMVMASLVVHNNLRVPELLYRWPAVIRFLSGTWGRGLLLGLGFAMALAALFEMWELVDRLLVRFMHDQDGRP